MNTTTIIIVVVVVVIVGILLAMVFSRSNRSRELDEKLGPEDNRTVETMGDEKKP